jgi:hypothetical protein
VRRLATGPRAASGCATAAALGCALLALPAAAAGKPGDPFDFERSPHATPAAAASAAGRAVVSTRIRLSRPFNLVGMRWRGGGEPTIHVRVRRPGRGWSRWQRLAAHADHNPDPRRHEPLESASDPLWVGTADGVQYRLSGPVPGLRLHFVNVAGRLRGARARAAQDPEPDFVSRAEWGAGQCPPRTAPDYGSVMAVVVHHTVSLNDYSRSEVPAMVLAICRYHRNSNGWNDIGYNALVDKYGVLYEGRAGGLDQPVIGAQAQGFNSQTAGIASIADHTTVAATPETLAALARYIRWKLEVHGQPLTGKVTVQSAGGPESRYGAGALVSVNRVIGHRDVGRTACPGDLLFGQLGELRAMVSTGVATVPSYATSLSATLTDYDARFGEAVALNGLLIGPNGSPVASQPVDLQVNSEGRWRTARRLTTTVTGAFTGDLEPRKRMYVRLRYVGNGQLRRATSSRLLLRLRPLVTLRRPPATVDRGARTIVAGTVGPRKRFLYLVLQQRTHGRYRKVAAKAVRARAGRFRTSFVAAFRARYRYAVVAKTDEDTDRGSTGWRSLSVR